MGNRPVQRGDVGRRVAERVRALRREREWTLEDLSRRLGDAGRPLIATGVSKIEDGSRRVDVDDLCALAQVFGVEVADLIGQRWWPLQKRTTADVATATGTAYDPTVRLSDEALDDLAERVRLRLRGDDRG